MANFRTPNTGRITLRDLLSGYPDGASDEVAGDAYFPTNALAGSVAIVAVSAALRLIEPQAMAGTAAVTVSVAGSHMSAPVPLAGSASVASTAAATRLRIAQPLAATSSTAITAAATKLGTFARGPLFAFPNAGRFDLHDLIPSPRNNAGDEVASEGVFGFNAGQPLYGDVAITVLAAAEFAGANAQGRFAFPNSGRFETADVLNKGDFADDVAVEGFFGPNVTTPLNGAVAIAVIARASITVTHGTPRFAFPNHGRFRFHDLIATDGASDEVSVNAMFAAFVTPSLSIAGAVAITITGSASMKTGVKMHAAANLTFIGTASNLHTSSPIPLAGSVAITTGKSALLTVTAGHVAFTIGESAVGGDDPLAGTQALPASHALAGSVAAAFASSATISRQPTSLAGPVSITMASSAIRIKGGGPFVASRSLTVTAAALGLKSSHPVTGASAITFAPLIARLKMSHALRGGVQIIFSEVAEIGPHASHALSGASDTIWLGVADRIRIKPVLAGNAPVIVSGVADHLVFDYVIEGAAAITSNAAATNISGLFTDLAGDAMITVFAQLRRPRRVVVDSSQWTIIVGPRAQWQTRTPVATWRKGGE